MADAKLCVLDYSADHPGMASSKIYGCEKIYSHQIGNLLLDLQGRVGYRVKARQPGLSLLPTISLCFKHLRSSTAGKGRLFNHMFSSTLASGYACSRVSVSDHRRGLYSTYTPTRTSTSTICTLIYALASTLNGDNGLPENSNPDSDSSNDSS